MRSQRTRRRLLLLCGGSMAALAGCASVVERFSEEDPQRDPTDERSPADEGSPTDTPSPTGESGTTQPSETSASTDESSDDAGSTEVTSTEDGTESSPTPTVDVDDEPPNETVAGAALPDDPGQHRYAIMGSSDATATATVWGNWKCPYTRQFVVGQLDDVVERFVTSGDLAIEFRTMAYRSGEPFLGPDAPRAARGGLAVWNTDPGSYWRYFSSVFENQPQERLTWATTDTLVRFASEASVADVDRVRQDLQGDAYVDEVQSNTDAVADLDVFSVPRVVVDGTVTAPTVDRESTVEQLERAIER